MGKQADVIQFKFLIVMDVARNRLAGAIKILTNSRFHRGVFSYNWRSTSGIQLRYLNKFNLLLTLQPTTLSYQFFIYMYLISQVTSKPATLESLCQVWVHVGSAFTGTRSRGKPPTRW